MATLPWHHSKKGDLQLAARKATLSPVPVNTLKPGDRFQTLHTKHFGKVVECSPEGEGVKVMLYILGSGWIERTIYHGCLVLQRE